ncbi:hypothetical protein ABK040_008574 [Willaertia magna]
MTDYYCNNYNNKALLSTVEPNIMIGPTVSCSDIFTFENSNNSSSSLSSRGYTPIVLKNSNKKPTNFNNVQQYQTSYVPTVAAISDNNNNKKYSTPLQIVSPQENANWCYPFLNSPTTPGCTTTSSNPYSFSSESSSFHQQLPISSTGFNRVVLCNNNNVNNNVNNHQMNLTTIQLLKQQMQLLHQQQQQAFKLEEIIQNNTSCSSSEVVDDNKNEDNDPTPRPSSNYLLTNTLSNESHTNTTLSDEEDEADDDNYEENKHVKEEETSRLSPKLLSTTTSGGIVKKKSTRGRKPKPKKLNCKEGTWTQEEHEQFLKGYEVCGKNWSKIADLFVVSRQRTQVASHAQKWLKKQERKNRKKQMK